MRLNLKVLYWFFSFLKVSLKLVYFNWRISTLQYCDGFYHNPSTWIGHRYTCVLLLKLLPSSLPLYLSWLSQSTGLGTLLHALNLHWSSVLNMVMYMLQCYSLKSSHPRILPLSPKSVLYVCVSFAALHVGSLVPSF